MFEDRSSSNLSWKKNMISKFEHINNTTSGLDVLADAATVSNYITGGEDKVVNTTSSHLQTHNQKTPMNKDIEHSDSERRKSLSANVLESQNASIVTDIDSDNGDYGRDTSYQTNLPSLITLGNAIKLSQPDKFLSMLMDVLSSASMESVITWLPEGNAFIVLNEEEFAKYVLPDFFDIIKFEYFVKKLYRWGFKQLTLGSNNKVFYHEYFSRDYPNLSCKISQCYDSYKMINNEMVDWHTQIMHLNVRNHRRRSSTSMISTSNITNNAQSNIACADTLIKNFFDRKMNEIRNQYLQESSYTRKYKRHSIGF